MLTKEPKELNVHIPYPLNYTKKKKSIALFTKWK